MKRLTRARLKTTKITCKYCGVTKPAVRFKRHKEGKCLRVQYMCYLCSSDKHRVRLSKLREFAPEPPPTIDDMRRVQPTYSQQQYDVFVKDLPLIQARMHKAELAGLDINNEEHTHQIVELVE